MLPTLVRYLNTVVPGGADKIVINALRASGGALNSRELHERLHKMRQTPLPSRPPPRRFLKGRGRALLDLQVGGRDHSSKSFPGKEESDGKWSMTYLKKHVMASLEAKGIVTKTTRRKWAQLVGAREPELPDTTTDEWKSKTKRERKITGQHVWVVADDLHKLREAAAGNEQRDDQQGSREPSKSV